MVPQFGYKKGKLFFPWVLSTQVSPARRRLINSWRSLHNKYRLCKPEAPQSACKAELGGLGHRLTLMEMRANWGKIKTPTEVGIKQPHHLLLAAVFVVSTRLFPVEAAWCGRRNSITPWKYQFYRPHPRAPAAAAGAGGFPRRFRGGLGEQEHPAATAGDATKG